MNRGDVRVAVLTIEGTNAETEMLHAFRAAGADAELVHLNQLIRDDLPDRDRRDLFDYHVLMIPGGFSSGDYVRAGAIFGARLRAALGDELVDFVEAGRAVGGVCNGFQVLVEAGLLPGLDGTISDEPRACLALNDSGRFECRPSLLMRDAASPFTSEVPRGRPLKIPSAHAEGNLVLPDGVYEELKANGQIAFRYVDPQGRHAGYPWNPNGSTGNVAGITNPEGNVFGMMPHPERACHGWLHGDWTRNGGDGPGDGASVFESVLGYVEDRFSPLG